jgi:RNA polymerase sigma-70 factor, ECF subfamily
VESRLIDIECIRLPKQGTISAKSFENLESRISGLFASLRLPLYRYFLVTLGDATEAEDMTQECFLRLYRRLHKGDQVEDPRLWLFHVARNLSLDRNKSGRLLREMHSISWREIHKTLSDPSPSAEQNMLDYERYEFMHNAMNRLTKMQMEVLTLRAEGLGYREIGDLMSLNTVAVAAHVRRAIARIRIESDDR